MILRHFLLLFFVFIFFALNAQVNPANITIARDQWGVPHIKAKTDAEAAYGLAWALAEDNFAEMQESLLAVRGKLSQVKGKDGAIMDYLAAAIDLKKMVNEKYETDLSPAYRKILDAYAQGANDYAARYPKEVLVKDVFPIDGKDIIEGYALAFTFLSGVQDDVIRIVEGTIGQYENIPTGSNGFAINAPKTKDGKTYLAVNSHQPLSGPYAWYEAHMISDEGLNILGATFPGGTNIFVGTNEHLGWTHTVNHPDLCDVYHLKMNPADETQYELDGKWMPLRIETLKLKVKTGFLKIPVKRKLYFSEHGPVFKTPEGEYYALRFPANRCIGAAEQWFDMNKAQNFEEFKTALKTMRAPSLNTIYADRAGNILYANLGRFSQDRDPAYDWKNVLPGNASKLIWSDNYMPFDSAVVYENPPSGYLFNTNNTPFHATAPEYNIHPEDINSTIGYLQDDNNRAKRFEYLIREKKQIDYQDFKRIKYDQAWAKPAYNFSVQNLEQLFQLDKKNYPDIAQSIDILQKWDRESPVESVGAALFRLVLHFGVKELQEKGIYPNPTPLNDAFYVKHLRLAQAHLLKHFGTINVTLGQLQQHVKGEVSMPISGLPDVVAAIYSAPQKDGRFHVVAGDSYIQMLRYSEEGVEIESANAYGASNRPDSPHYTDQMDLYVNHKLKKMTLDWEEIVKNAERVYQLK